MRNCSACSSARCDPSRLEAVQHLMEGVPQSLPKPRIIDFGIAKVMQPGRRYGTLYDCWRSFWYSSVHEPEQALMSASSLTFASDVYSLGVVLYELIREALREKSLAIQPWSHLGRPSVLAVRGAPTVASQAVAGPIASAFTLVEAPA